MTTTSLIEILDAAHLTRYIQSPFEQRGGIMLVGPPGILKTSVCRSAYRCYPDALFLSDLNVNSLMSLRESLINGRYASIIFPEFEKLYQRKSDTAANIEGTIKQLIEEGFTRASFEEQDAITCVARTLIVGAMTYNFYNRMIQRWRESGFKRRFLWCGIKLANPDAIMHAIRRWELINIDGIPRKFPAQDISYNLNEKESLQIENMLKGQWEATPYVLLKKIFIVLKWKYQKEPDKPLELLREFSDCINNKLGVIQL